ncbi:MAG: tetraacyldisaccharide 4'-kinase [Elusimicrobiota bacterium]|jgi:tetraacyldisaccharide 4'-kinase|nr:tetraacyldisaccharide 4'-kinase [Elusimicrobiota bacterium]
MNKLLYPLSCLYGVLSKADRALKKPRKLSKPVISVGNITWGGSGKTPIVIELAKFITDNGKKPAILTRGYGRKSKEPILLQDGGGNIDIAKSGDEPLLIAKSVPEASIIIGANRYENALKFESEIAPDVYILDDGFQHWKIHRDLDIVCINAANPFGNDMLIPAGILREKPKESLKRAGLVIVTNSDFALNGDVALLETLIWDWTAQYPAMTYYGGFQYKKLNLKTVIDLDDLRKQKIVLLSAIGFAKGFKNSVEKSGLQISGAIEFPDHKFYTLKGLKKILSSLSKENCLIITAKDAVKIEQIADEELNERIAVLTVRPIFRGEDIYKAGNKLWQEKILKVLASS